MEKLYSVVFKYYSDITVYRNSIFSNDVYNKELSEICNKIFFVLNNLLKTKEERKVIDLNYTKEESIYIFCENKYIYIYIEKSKLLNIVNLKIDISSLVTNYLVKKEKVTLNNKKIKEILEFIYKCISKELCEKIDWSTR